MSKAISAQQVTSAEYFVIFSLGRGNASSQFCALFSYLPCNMQDIRKISTYDTQNKLHSDILKLLLVLYSLYLDDFRQKTTSLK